MKRVLSTLLAAVLLVAALGGCGGGGASSAAPAASGAAPAGSAASGGTSAAAPGKTIQIRLGFAEADTSPHTKGYKKIAENLEADSNGLLKVSLYPSNQLGGERDMYEGNQVGSIEASIITNSTLDSFIPEITVLDQPFLFDTEDQAHKVIDGKFGDLMKQKSEAKGVEIVGWCDSGFRNIFSVKPINSPNDLKGLKIRTMESDVQMAIYKSFGCIPTPMDFGSVFTAMQQHNIDAYENSIANMYANHFYEVCKYAVNSKAQFAFQAVCISKKVWDQIPEDMKPKLIEGVKEGCEVERQALADANKEDQALAEKAGVKFVDIDRAALASVSQAAMKQFKFDENASALLTSEIAAAKG